MLSDDELAKRTIGALARKLAISEAQNAELAVRLELALEQLAELRSQPELPLKQNGHAEQPSAH
jgi:hypothetical protein